MSAAVLISNLEITINESILLQYASVIGPVQRIRIFHEVNKAIIVFYNATHGM